MSQTIIFFTALIVLALLIFLLTMILAAIDAGKPKQETISIIISLIVALPTAGVAIYSTTLTRESNQINREAFAVVQRAFVVARRVLDQSASPEKAKARQEVSVSFLVELSNSGNTPTKDMEVIVLSPRDDTFTQMHTAMSNPVRYADALQRSRSVARTLNAPDDPARFFENPEAWPSTRDQFAFAAQRHKYILGPKDSVRLYEVDNEYFASHVEHMFSGTLSSFYYGIVKYRDIFSDTPWHTTKFCFNVASAIYAIGPNIRLPIVDFCRYWNCADDECVKDKEEYDKERKALPPTLPGRRPFPPIIIEPGATLKVR